MADKRTNFPIPKNTWVQVLNASVSATMYKEKSTSNYMSLIYNADVGTDDPNALFPLTSTENQAPPTSQLMFSDGLIEEFNDPIPTYYWVACKSGEAGSIIVTP